MEKDSRGLASANGSTTIPTSMEKGYRSSFFRSGKDELGVTAPLIEALLALEQR
jgi:hypothetical protein